ncbi:MAG: UDP-N-acetylmuramate dehydrogenase [Phycisphaerales bacterium]|nr:UDP-N-acetylmuramate dehydrogenase [Phycisphaerales bacterium]
MSASIDHFRQSLVIEQNAQVSTWFHIGGRAEQLALPKNSDELIQCLEIDDEFNVLGEGANLLVNDTGVEGLVVSLQTDEFKHTEIDATTGIVRAGSGAALPALINRCVRNGLGGLEVLSGIPATLGGAVIMNAGGAFGSLSDFVISVTAIDRAGRTHVFERSQIDFGYRQSLLNHLIITEVVLQLEQGDIGEIKSNLNRCMDYKSKSQPLGEKSAGCVFKNPVLLKELEGIGVANTRVGAGMLIDRAGCKGLAVRGAQVSQVHANFMTTTKDAKAQDVIELISLVQHRVFDVFGVTLERELVIWGDDEHINRSTKESI